MNILSAFTWNISPEIVDFWGIQIRWYGLLFASGFVVGYQIMQWIFNKEGKSLKDLEALTLTMILGTVIGARLGHCLFYEPEYYLMNPLEILKVWHGGLASHGAAVGILTALWLFSRKHKDISYLWILDRIVIVIALAGCFIRLGNFFNSEIIGIPADVPWAVIFERVDMLPRHPAQIYESISYLFIFFILIFRYKKFGAGLPAGQLFGLFLVLIFGARFVIEFYKRNQVGFESGMILDMGQLLSIPLILTGIYFVYRSLNNKSMNKK